MKFTKVAAIAAVAAVMAGCGQSDSTVPMDKLVMQYKSIVAGRSMNRHVEFSNITVSNVKCKTEKMAILCRVDGAGQVSIRNSLDGTVETKTLDDKNLEMKFFNREGLSK